MDLSWTAGGPLVAGPGIRAHPVEGSPGTRHVGLRFAPGTGPRVLGVPAHELRDARMPLDALRPERTVRELTERGPGRLRRAPDGPLSRAVAAALRDGGSVAALPGTPTGRTCRVRCGC
ncbi:MAG TPA: hypothetical protein VE546_00195 [Streptomyces sp.]|uniref:hypothetical protein n=1 Tax=Streptomyces sp. TaxID=1931 RepID=UPI002D338BCC|nr:hypothetical protein [Streptomyces sp.]HZG01987.1 hypothetical protein [Streptomyces sp.]